ncbi:Adenosine deaminase, partial [Gryllus bimaculatus]
GDLNALERIAYEFCEDKVREGVLYVEVRYSPRMLLGKKLPVPRARAIQDLAEVVMAINRGFRVGEREFGIVVRTILTLVAGKNGCS